jgi:hypothetical protein
MDGYDKKERELARGVYNKYKDKGNNNNTIIMIIILLF